MRRFILFLMMLLFWSHGAKAMFTEISARFIQVNSTNSYGTNYTYDLTPLSMSPASTTQNLCYKAKVRCGVFVVVQGVYANGQTQRIPTSPGAPILTKNDAGGCNTPTCNVSIYKELRLGPVVPLFNKTGHFGKTTRSTFTLPHAVVGIQLCVLQQTSRIQNGEIQEISGVAECGPTIPLITRCDVLDDTAIVDFGSFSNDIKNVKASGSFRVNCSSEAYVRIKFSSSVSNMPLSQDGNLNATLKIRDAIKGVTDLDSVIKVPSGGKEIIIDGELNNNNTSHTGPFSASVVAIVEIA